MQAEKVRPRHLITSAIAAEPGVEPELYTPTPRRVVPKPFIIRCRLWCANLVAGVLLLAFYQLRTGSGRYFDFSVYLLILLAIIVIGQLVVEHTAKRATYFLRNGYAVRATVVSCESNEAMGGYLEVRYRYTAPNAKSITEHFSISEEAALTAGAFAPGSTFTVLVDPTECYEVLPYFLATEADIPGAAPPRTTPPAAP